jgi:hypothetical protein
MENFEMLDPVTARVVGRLSAPKHQPMQKSRLVRFGGYLVRIY